MQVSIVDGKNTFSQLVRLAELGSQIIFMRHGRAVAMLCQLPPELRPPPEDDEDPFARLLDGVDDFKF